MNQDADMVVAKLRSALAWRLGARYASGTAGVAMFAMGGLVLLVRLCDWPFCLRLPAICVAVCQHQRS